MLLKELLDHLLQLLTIIPLDESIRYDEADLPDRGTMNGVAQSSLLGVGEYAAYSVQRGTQLHLSTLSS